MVFQNDIIAGAVAAANYEINQSIRFNADDSAYLSRTFGTPTDATNWTFSAWIKRGILGTDQMFFNSGASAAEYYIKFESTDKIRFRASTSWDITTTQVFRDVSAWYHIVATFKNGVVTLYINNKSIATASVSDGTYNFFTNIIHSIGGSTAGTSTCDFYAAEIYGIDGQALAPTNFSETNNNGVWVPKQYAGTYGNNGFYLKGQNSAALGDDTSGNGNDFTSSGLTTSSQVLDTPTNNYCVMSSLVQSRDSNITNSDGIRKANLQLYRPSSTANSFGSGTMSIYGGTGSPKLYFECYTTLYPAGNVLQLYIEEATSTNAQPTNSFGLDQRHTTDARRLFIYPGGSETPSSWTSEFGEGVYVGLAVDFSNDEISANVDGTEIFSYNASELAALSGITLDTFAGRWWRPKIQVSNDEATTIDVNFGQNTFQNAPSGYVGWSTSAIQTPTVFNGSSYFQTTLYTGNGTAIGSGGNEVTQSGNSVFQPDLVWIKERNGAADHALYDTVRGATKDLVSNTTNAETTQSEGLTTFGSSGFTVGNLAKVNTNSDTYVAWQWLAGNSTSSNTDGDITSTVSVNTTAGFSILTYSGSGTTGDTVGHGLGLTPSVVIVKPQNASDNWIVSNWETGVSAFSEKLLLNASDVPSSAATFVNAANSTTFTLGSDANVNGSGRTFVAYCWNEVEGFSKFGTYTGNGSADGPFVWCGFRPNQIVVKEVSVSDDWVMYDSARDPYNVAGQVLRADNGAAEFDGRGGSRDVDFLSSGFKFRTSNNTVNFSGSNYIFWAFAEHPFGGNGVAPATAR